jgi:hypothetical protein
MGFSESDSDVLVPAGTRGRVIECANAEVVIVEVGGDAGAEIVRVSLPIDQLRVVSAGE